MEKTGVIIVAGGKGERVGGTIPKQFRFLDGRPLLAHTIETFRKALPFAQIVVVLPEKQLAFWNDLCARFDIPRHKAVSGGSERFHSVKCGIAALDEDVEFIAVQDGVRPLCSRRIILDTLEAAQNHGAAIPVTEVADSYRIVEQGRSHITDRSRLRIVQTPQIFRAWLLKEAYAQEFSPHFTDDASVVEAFGEEIFLTRGERENLKITTPEDFAIAEALIACRKAEEAESQHPEEA